MNKSVFQKIIDGEIPAKIIYETNDVLAFHDINPQAPVHVLVIPKKPFARIAEVPEEEEHLLGKLLATAVRAAEICQLKENGFRIVINNGSHGGETVPHLHVHVLGGRQMGWPPG